MTDQIYAYALIARNISRVNTPITWSSNNMKKKLNIKMKRIFVNLGFFVKLIPPYAILSTK